MTQVASLILDIFVKSFSSFIYSNLKKNKKLADITISEYIRY